MKIKDIKPVLASGGLAIHPVPMDPELPSIPGYTAEDLKALPPEELKKLLAKFQNTGVA